MKTYIRYLLKIFFTSLLFVTGIIFSLVLILNLLSELEFFKDLNVDTYFPIILSFLNSPDMIFQMFPFILLITTQLFFIKLFENNEIEILKRLKYINLYYFDNDSICINFLVGNNFDSSELKKYAKIITKKIKDFHNINFKTDKFWEDVIPSWFDKINDIILRNKLITIYQNLNKFEKDENDLVLCHHDIHGDNIIKNKNDLYFIDLEFSFTDYFFVDLGNLVCEMYTDYHNQNYNFENNLYFAWCTKI